MSDFAVNLSDPLGDVCAVSGCRGSVRYIATLAYCFCDADPNEHGHPGSPDATRHDVSLCPVHAAGVRSWECLERIHDQVGGAA